MVEAAEAQTARMERNRDVEVGERQIDFCDPSCEPDTERRGKTRNEAVFVGMDGLGNERIPILGSGEKPVERIFSETGETDFSSRGGGFQAGRTALPQTARENLQTGCAEILIRCAAADTADRKERVEDADADLFEKGMADET